MIFSQGDYPFDGAESVVLWPCGYLRVCTAKDGFQSLQSTIISYITTPNASPVENVKLAKIFWNALLNSKERQHIHHEFVDALSAMTDQLSSGDLVEECDNLSMDPTVVFTVLSAAVESQRIQGRVKEFPHSL